MSAKPASAADAHAIQDAMTAALGDESAGRKVAGQMNGQLARGAILRSVVFDSPARISAAIAPMLGVEAEIAFRFERDMPPRARD